MRPQVLVLCAMITVLMVGTAAMSETVVNFATWGSTDAQRIWRRDIAEFERQNPDIKVNLIATDFSTHFQRMPLMLAGTIEADVVRIGGQHLPTFAHHGFLLSLDPYVRTGQIDRREFLAPILESTTYGGRLYGLPDHFSPVVLYYNVELFKEYGLSDPYSYYRDGGWTWGTFKEIGSKLLKDRAGTGLAAQWGISNAFSPTHAHVRQAMILANGGRVYNDDLTQYYLDEAPSVAALQWLADLRDLTGGGWEAGVLGMTPGNPSVQATWAKTLGFEFGVAPLPKPETGSYATVMTTNIMSIVKSAKNPEAAVRFINYIVGPEVQRRRIGDNYVVSARTDIAIESLREGHMAAKNNQVIMDITGFTKPWMVPIDHYDDIPNLVNRELAQLARGEEAAASAAKRITQMVNAILGTK